MNEFKAYESGRTIGRQLEQSVFDHIRVIAPPPVSRCRIGDTAWVGESGGMATIELARKTLGIIHHLLQRNCGEDNVPDFVVAKCPR